MASDWTADKIYDRCAYLNCYNGKYSTGHKLFRFPAYSDSRHHLWIRYTGNVRLRTWASATVRRAGICAEHFDSEAFIDETRQSLRRHAVPKPYSATDGQAQPSSTLLAQIESLSRKPTRTRKVTDDEDAEVEFEAQTALRSSDANDPPCGPVKTMPVEAHLVKTLRKVKRIKIVEQVSNSSRTAILEKCKNPETCPANRQAMHEGGKPRPHFHKTYIKNAAQTGPSNLGTLTEPSNVEKSDDGGSVLKPMNDKERFEEFCEDAARSELPDEEATKVDVKQNFQLKRYTLNLVKDIEKKEEPSTFTRYSAEPQNSMTDWQAIQDARAASVLEIAPDNVGKKPRLTNEFIEQYYKSKDERSFDRCAYINCKNGRFTTGAHLFRFPQITNPRFTTWIKNAGNPRLLYWSWSTIRHAGICADHFTKDCFYNETRQRLLRTAIPKPFYLESNVSAGAVPGQKLSQTDLLNVFRIIEKERENGMEESHQPMPIDLPLESTENPENLKIRYPFEEPEFTETDKEADVMNSSGINAVDDSYESFASVMVEREPSDRREDDDADRILSTSSGLPYFTDKLIEEPEEDPLDDASSVTNEIELDSEGADNIREMVALQQQKARLCKFIKQFSTKLKNAKIRKTNLQSRLLAYSDQTPH